ncbi:PREDICTED: SH3 and multiple ankyrin repeat domains protein 3 isoform X2 [Nicrophorus vespilloides]|uniref:SH3 and multiple ankyrin repeat domains protein 3 isoform X2 n=1 Tax=Nicrophorus vespilloides TaxID=110193 RepID=A0ABM1M4Z8_NICVS|nr:PREDICTED: SH3 and multiple ankyrin repeat domains protein 3 isoform X2 [Nicrophorus vespilloides]
MRLFKKRTQRGVIESQNSFRCKSAVSWGRGMEGDGDRCADEGYLLVRIHVPELNVQKCLQFPRDQLVWDVKQQCLAALPKELKESFNYGLFCPPENGRAGKFLDEERRLGDYPFNGPVGYLELKYKRRVYKMLSLDEKQLKSLHTRANLRRFLDYVTNGQVEKITKMCSKGLDPNFHCQESGETPLTIATGVKKPGKVLIALVNGGALLDYRTRDGTTAMHRAVESKNLEAMKTLLELGASPNYKDSKSITPLYLTVTHNVEPIFAEILLHDHATIGAQDLQGWHEVHQACRTGLFQHLEHLLFYGANMNARNASGNTPLHICAVFNQESCARQLLFRGAERQALNYANQSPYQVAVIAGNMELAEIIQTYKQEDVVVYRGPPTYNPKRRSAIGWLSRAPSIGCLALPPSPCPSDRSSAPYSSASSSMSDASHMPHGNETDDASIITDKSLVDSDIISDSSGVGTANSDTTIGSISLPGTTVVCIESFTAHEEGQISIREGDIIEVTGATDDGYLEGTLKPGGGRNGLFPANCVQEVRLRHHNIQAPMMVARDRNSTQPRIETTSSRVLGRRESTSKHFATAPRLKKSYSVASAEPRTVVLHRGRKGFGFILRGAKATSPLMELTPSDKCPGLQYLDDVDPGGVADIAGLRKGDFLLEINKEDVSSASHEHVVDLIRKSGDLVSMTVVSLGGTSGPGTLPSSKSTILQSGNTDVPLSRQYATLPRKLGNSTNTGTLGRSQAPLPPRRDPKTTLSVGRARAKSMVAGLEAEKEETDDITKSSSAESIHQGTGNSTPVQPRTASIRQRPTSSRITSAELEELFQRQRGDDNRQPSLMSSSNFQSGHNTISSPAKGRVYASVSEMKRCKGKPTKVRFNSSNVGELHRDFHSTPDLAAALAAASTLPTKSHRSQEDVTILLGNRSSPPNHPPPPPPTGQVIKVDVRNSTDCDNLNSKENGEEPIVSSFRPTATAKLYASPEDVKTVGYRSRSLPSHTGRTVRKSHSMRTSSTFKPSSTTAAVIPNAPPALNPYAQPINRASRSHSITGSNKDRKKRNSTPGIETPPIPEPDYSCSESDSEDEKKHGRLGAVQLHPIENSGNSNASGSSSGSSSIPHSFSVDEIQKGRSQLKSSKSYPDDFLKKQAAALEDGDNSSSGVSSDQEVPAPSHNQEFAEPRIAAEVNSLTLPSTKGQRQSIGTMYRHAMSLAQLPPPLEADSDEKEEFCLPPPPEFTGENGAPQQETPEAVLAPPPQFSDVRHGGTGGTRVRIVGAVPKLNPSAKVKHGRLHSQ